MKKLRVGVIFGGRSGEHEVSVVSAASIFRHLDRARYEAVPIRIEKDGRWTIAARPPEALSAADVPDETRTEALQPVEPTAAVTGAGIDVVFPVLHGPYGEDGTVQGLLELANVPYVGAGVLGSAVGMDKAVMKTLFAARGLPIVLHEVVVRPEWERDRTAITGRVSRTLRYPVFVKPANLGSSVGISKAKSDSEFGDAMALALQYDRKVVIEAGVTEAREIECAVLGNDEPEASVPGEIIPSREFYDYQAKYLHGGSTEVIPAALTGAQAREVQRLAIEAFRALDCAGMARVDFLLERVGGTIYVNELNTIPGFTSNSMYPKMWDASGVPYPTLLDRLIRLALERHAEKQHLRTSIT
ncbi:MAG: D-alanine--D-alanine ligase family protein [Candidatus Rokuibacteriota bacterium]